MTGGSASINGLPLNWGNRCGVYVAATLVGLRSSRWFGVFPEDWVWQSAIEHPLAGYTNLLCKAQGLGRFSALGGLCLDV